MSWSQAKEQVAIRSRADWIVLGMLIVLLPLWVPLLILRCAWELADGGYHFIEDLIR